MMTPQPDFVACSICDLCQFVCCLNLNSIQEAMCLFFSVAATLLLWVDFDFPYVDLASRKIFQGTPWNRNFVCSSLVVLHRDASWNSLDGSTLFTRLQFINFRIYLRAIYYNWHYLMSLMTSYFMIILHPQMARLWWIPWGCELRHDGPFSRWCDVLLMYLQQGNCIPGMLMMLCQSFRQCFYDFHISTHENTALAH